MTASPSWGHSDDRFVPTPASHDKPPWVAVFGAGIAGLTAAHELAERGFKVTVCEPTLDRRPSDEHDERVEPLPDTPSSVRPDGLEVRLGGMAATQYPTLRAFPTPDGTKSSAVPPRGATGEHGFRFFPAYYLHLWDMLQRIPVYDQLDDVESAEVTPRTVYDNVRRVITQAVTALDGLPSLVLPRESPRSIAELHGIFNEIRQLGFTQTDISTFIGRIMRFLVTSPERRAKELEDVSAYEFFVGLDPDTGVQRYHYSSAFERQIRDMPKILAGFDSRFGDARTNISTYVQLNMALDRYDSKADGVLNGPTTEAWFDDWYIHLKKLGVDFKAKLLRGFTLERGVLTAWVVPSSQAWLDHDLKLHPEEDAGENPRTDADPLTWGLVHDRDEDDRVPDYYVVATDAFRAELATRWLRARPDHATAMDHLRRLVRDTPKEIERKRALRAMSTIIGLDGWATSAPPADPRQLNRAGLGHRNPLQFDQLGTVKWDRFQTLSGIQYFFDTEFQLVRGHVYYSNSEWGLSAINQSGFWMDKPNLNTRRYVSVMSVDVGDWNTPSCEEKPARECTREEIALEVWRQITVELLDTFGYDVVARQLPRPIWYSVDEFIVFKDQHDDTRATDAEGLEEYETPRYNRAPYLIPLVGDWKNRPGAYPWGPQGTSNTVVPNDAMRAMQQRLHVWQAGHGGYEVHHDKLVFAGTWCKSFTRMTSMEAACESGRHAVNAILDHYVYEQSGRTDERDLPALSWRMPFGFVDQELSIPIRQPTPAGDYCFIFDCENREPADARPTRAVDSDYFRAGLAHPWHVWGIDNASAVASNYGAYGPAVDPYAPAMWIVDQVRQWRKFVETTCAASKAESCPDGPRPGAPPPSEDQELLDSIGLVDRPPDQGGGGIYALDPYGDSLDKQVFLDQAAKHHRPGRHRRW